LPGKRRSISEGIELSVWRIHRKIGMSGGLFTNQLLRETHSEISPERWSVCATHADAYRGMARQVRPLPGARELLAALTEAARAGPSRPAAGWKPRRSISRRSASIRRKSVVVTRDEVKYAKPDPISSLPRRRAWACRSRPAVVVGDSIWDMLAARALPRAGRWAAVGRLRSG
jgi:phosphoglycolate phosphatase-like HAD superfamily hydrolase